MRKRLSVSRGLRVHVYAPPYLRDILTQYGGLGAGLGWKGTRPRTADEAKQMMVRGDEVQDICVEYLHGKLVISHRAFHRVTIQWHAHVHLSDLLAHNC